MIFKSDLLDAINNLSYELSSLGIRVTDLEDNMKRIQKKTCENRLEKAIKDVTTPKRRGRPAGSKDNKPRPKQPRDKLGKFMKKK